MSIVDITEPQQLRVHTHRCHDGSQVHEIFRSDPKVFGPPVPQQSLRHGPEAWENATYYDEGPLSGAQQPSLFSILLT